MRKQVNSWYRYNPCMWDIVNPPVGEEMGLLKAGDRVKTINMHGCPRFGTMGQGYIQNEKGEFCGMVSLASLEKI